jgi:uncharacterized protein (TIGR03663 family)
MRYPQKCCVLILAVTTVAVALRLPRLEQRPMHGDEAVHAVKFGELLEKKDYRYDRSDYHGPVLNYFSLIPSWLTGAKKLTEVNESTLRIVPVFFGVMLVLILLLLVEGLGPAAVYAAVLVAFSPALVYYSRYYIQETLLVCFTFGLIVSGYRYTKRKNIMWALSAGLFFGLMHATKETCLIAYASIFLAGILTLLVQRKTTAVSDSTRKINPWHLAAAIATAVFVSVLFYSSFFKNPQGVLDSLISYKIYLARARQSLLHIHPWYYYLKMLIYYKYGVGSVWSEGLIVFLAVIGFTAVMAKEEIPNINPNLMKFIAFYSLILTVSYCVISYKTPWSMIGFLHGMVLLAGIGAAVVIHLSPNILSRTIICLILIAASAHLAWQAYLASYRYYADPVNPYVYAHSLESVLGIAPRVEDIANVHPDKNRMHIQVICPDDDYWPLPWYFRSLPNVGWWNRVTDDMPIAPVIIASSRLEAALMKRLYELPPPGQRHMYVPLFDTYTILLRPQVKLIGLVRKDLWDSYQQVKK